MVEALCVTYNFLSTTHYSSFVTKIKSVRLTRCFQWNGNHFRNLIPEPLCFQTETYLRIIIVYWRCVVCYHRDIKGDTIREFVTLNIQKVTKSKHSSPLYWVSRLTHLDTNVPSIPMRLFNVCDTSISFMDRRPPCNYRNIKSVDDFNVRTYKIN